MKEPEERNGVEEREADPDSMSLVPLDASTPMPLEKGLAMVKVNDRRLFHNYGITPNHHWLENITRAEQSDQAYQDREAARKRTLIAAWAPIITAVSSAVG